MSPTCDEQIRCPAGRAGVVVSRKQGGLPVWEPALTADPASVHPDLADSNDARQCIAGTCTEFCDRLLTTEARAC